METGGVLRPTSVLISGRGRRRHLDVATNTPANAIESIRKPACQNPSIRTAPRTAVEFVSPPAKTRPFKAKERRHREFSSTRAGRLASPSRLEMPVVVGVVDTHFATFTNSFIVEHSSAKSGRSPIATPGFRSSGGWAVHFLAAFERYPKCSRMSLLLDAGDCF